MTRIISTTSLRPRGAEAPPSQNSLALRQPDEELRARVIAFKAEHELSDNRLASLAGTNSTQVNRYINGRFLGDLAAFEEKMRELFKAEEVRRINVDDLFDNPFTRNVRSFLDTVRRTQDMGLGFSPAGKGKTSGIALYRDAHSAAIAVTLSQWNCGPTGLAKLLFKSFDHRGWNRKMSQAEFVVSRLRGSRRLVIIDNAHRLTAMARRWIFDFHDETECGVALVGNPELLDEVRTNDQQFSRIGIKWEFKSARRKDQMHAALDADCERMILAHWPEAAGQLGDLPQQVARHHGYLRSLKKQLLLAREVSGDFATPSEAFRAAHTQLVRDYPLV